MAKSYEEATEERAAEDLGDPEPEPETDPGIEVRTAEELADGVEDIAKAVPEFLRPESSQRRVQTDVGGRRGALSVDVDLSRLDDLDQRGLLEVIARVNIAQLSAMFDIADAVEPLTSITVSGVNAIDNADAEEPVVPESDDEEIPTRTLFMRASEDNTDKIYIGDDKVEPDSGLVLGPGEFYVAETDLRAEELYMASGTAGVTIQLLGMV